MLESTSKVQREELVSVTAHPVLGSNVFRHPVVVFAPEAPGLQTSTVQALLSLQALF